MGGSRWGLKLGVHLTETLNAAFETWWTLTECVCVGSYAY